MVEKAGRKADIANRVVQLETTVVTERTASLDGSKLDRRQGVGKLGKLDASAKGAWNDKEPVMLSYIGQLDWELILDKRLPLLRKAAGAQIIPS